MGIAIMDDYIIEPTDEELFTDRVEILNLFDGQYRAVEKHIAEKTFGYEAIYYNGVAGLGKSFLLQHISRYVKRKYKSPVINCDFEKINTRADIIIQLVEQFVGAGIGFEFPLTAAALMRTGNSDISPEAYKPMNTIGKVESNKYVAIAKAILKCVPTIGSYISLIDDLKNINDSEWKNNNEKIARSLINATKDPKHKETLEREILNYDNTDDTITQKLHEYFRLDLSHNVLEWIKKNDSPLVVLIDTYERYNDNGASDNWFKKIIQKVPFVLWVIAGRDKLPTNVWPKDLLEQIKIEKFSESDIKVYLEKCGIIDLEVIKEFQKISDGIPLILSLLRKRYYELRENSEEKNYEEYGSDNHQILERYVKYIYHADIKVYNLLYQLAFFEDGWTDEQIQLMKNSLEYYDPSIYESVINDTMISKGTNGKYSIIRPIHNILLKEAENKNTTLIESTRSSFKDYYKNEIRKLEVFSSIECILGFIKNSSNEEIVEEFNNYILSFLDSSSYQLLNNAEIVIKAIKERKIDDLVLNNNIAYLEWRLFCNKGNYKEALEIIEPLYKTNKEKVGEDNPGTLLFLGFLASTLSGLGKYDDALIYSRKCYESRKRILGDEDSATLTALNDYAYVLSAHGDYKEALDKNKHCYQLRSKLLGEENPATLTSLNNVATSLINLEEYDEGLVKLEDCYKMRKKIIGEKNPDTIKTLLNIALVLDKLEQYDIALSKVDDCYKLSYEVFGEKHPENLNILSSFGLILLHLERYKEALDKLKPCYKYQKIVLGKDHPDSLTTLNLIVAALKNLQKYKEALKKGESCYELRKKVLGEDHPDTLESLSALAVILLLLKSKEEALDKFVLCYQLRMKRFGENDPDTQLCLHIILRELGSLEKEADLCHRFGSFNKCFSNNDLCYRLRTRIFGEDDPKAMTNLNNAAIALMHLEQYKDALTRLETCYQLKRKTLGDNHPETLIALDNIAYDLINLEHYDEALKKAEDCYDLKKKQFGERNQNTLETLDIIIEALQKLGRNNEANEKIRQRLKAMFGL